MLTATVPFFLAVLSVVVYFAASNPKVTQVAIVSYGCSLLVALLSLSGSHAIHLP
jgi:hypothetical protein